MSWGEVIMTSRRSTWIAFSLLLISLGLLVSCTGSGGKSLTDGVLDGAAGAFGDDDGFDLISDPTEIVIDLTDPNTPVDPDTGKAFAKIDLLATALDELGAPQEGLEIEFTSTAGELESAGNPVLTDVDGLAADTLLVFEDDPESIDVTATDGTRMASITLAKPVI